MTTREMFVSLLLMIVPCVANADSNGLVLRMPTLTMAAATEFAKMHLMKARQDLSGTIIDEVVYDYVSGKWIFFVSDSSGAIGAHGQLFFFDAHPMDYSYSGGA